MRENDELNTKLRADERHYLDDRSPLDPPSKIRFIYAKSRMQKLMIRFEAECARMAKLTMERCQP